MMISDTEVEKLELDQRRSKSAPDGRRAETIAQIIVMRELERRLADVRAYVDEWEEPDHVIFGILDRVAVERSPSPSLLRRDRRHRRIEGFRQRFLFAKDTVQQLQEYVRAWGKEDGQDILAILDGSMSRERLQ